MDICTWTLVIGALSLCIYIFYRKKRHNFKDWGIPQPREVPFLGIVGPQLIRPSHLSDFMKQLYDLNKDAKYVGMHRFMTPVVVIRDIDLIKSILVKNFDHFADHKQLLDDTFEPLLTKNLSAINGEKWHELRQLLSPAFTSSKMRAMFELMSNCAENFTKSFAEQFTKEEATDIKDAFSKYTNDVIATCAFGIEIDSQKDPKNEFYVYGKEITDMGVYFQLVALAKVLVMLVSPKLAKALGMRIIRDKITKFFINFIDSAVKERDEKGILRPDMLQLMMNAREKSTENMKLDIVNMTAQAFIFFVAGFETTSTHMCLLTHEVAVNPDIQEKLHVEIDATSQGAINGKVTYEAIANMPYLDAVFQETLRLHPQAGLLNRHCTKTYELPATLPGAKPYVLQPGDEIMIPVTGIHQDPAFFENPTKFDPERFVEKKITSTGDPTNLGFGIGPRMCIGNRFAILETKVLFYHLLKKYRLQPCAKTCVPLKYDKAKLSPIPKEGFWLQIKER